jgi:hypothetical protein
MSPRYGPSSRAVFRLQSNTIARLHDLPDLFMRSDLRSGSKVPYHVSTSLQNFVRALSQPHKEKPNMANKTFKQNGVRSQDPLKDASKRPSSAIVHINTRDILTMDWRRRAVEQAVQNARHLIQAHEEEIAESERRIAELYSWESIVSGEESSSARTASTRTAASKVVARRAPNYERKTSWGEGRGRVRQEYLTQETTRAAWELSSVRP